MLTLLARLQFHDYIETEADPKEVSVSSVRTRSTESRPSSLNISLGQSAFIGDLSTCSVADDLLMQAEQAIALETVDTSPTANDDVLSDDGELAVPGSFIQAGLPSGAFSKPRLTADPVSSGRPWTPVDWRVLMESLDAAGPTASVDDIIESFKECLAVQERHLVGEWSRSVLFAPGLIIKKSVRPTDSSTICRINE